MSTAFRHALVPTQPPIQWALTPVSNGRGMKLTTHLHHIPRLRMRGSVSLLSQYVFRAWCLISHRPRLHDVVLS
jgi:hypothetical protein